MRKTPGGARVGAVAAVCARAGDSEDGARRGGRSGAVSGPQQHSCFRLASAHNQPQSSCFGLSNVVPKRSKQAAAGCANRDYAAAIEDFQAALTNWGGLSSELSTRLAQAIRAAEDSMAREQAHAATKIS